MCTKNCLECIYLEYCEDSDFYIELEDVNLICPKCKGECMFKNYCPECNIIWTDEEEE